MSKITEIVPQKKNPRRFNIFLDGQFAFGAGEDLVVEYRLVPEKIIEQSLLEKLLFEAEVGKLMERIYQLFSVRARSEKEVRDYLRNLSFKRKIKSKEIISDTVADFLIEKLKRKGFINDLEFAKAWTEARRRSKQKGIRAIKLELFQKGIDKEIIEEVTRVESLESSEEELAKQALKKKMRTWKNLDPQKLRQKAIEFLLRKGFEYEVVKEAIEKIIKKE